MKRVFAVVLALIVTVAVIAQEAPRKYEIKSGIVKVVNTVMGQKIETMMYFDDYGALESSTTKTAVPGQGEVEISTISRDGKVYVINRTARQVQEMPAAESINYLNITDADRKKYKIQELGTESVGERECVKYSEEISQMGQKATATIWVYKGFPIKSVTSVMGMEILSETVEFTENGIVIPAVFNIPQY